MKVFNTSEDLLVIVIFDRRMNKYGNSCVYSKVKHKSSREQLKKIHQDSSFEHVIISSHWMPSWLFLQITLAIYSEI